MLKTRNKTITLLIFLIVTINIYAKQINTTTHFSELAKKYPVISKEYFYEIQKENTYTIKTIEKTDEYTIVEIDGVTYIFPA